MFGVHAGELDDIDYAALEVGYLKRKKRREGSHDYFIFQQEQKAIPPHRVNTEYKKKRLETQAKTFVYKDFLHITSSNCFNTCTSLPQAEEPSAESILCFHHCTDRFFEARDIVLAGYLEYVGGISFVFSSFFLPLNF